MDHHLKNIFIILLFDGGLCKKKLPQEWFTTIHTFAKCTHSSLSEIRHLKSDKRYCSFQNLSLILWKRKFAFLMFLKIYKTILWSIENITINIRCKPNLLLWPFGLFYNHFQAWDVRIKTISATHIVFNDHWINAFPDEYLIQ